MPLLPLPILRVIEGLLAIVCVTGGLLCVWLFVLAQTGALNELFGIAAAPLTAVAGVLFVLAGAWFGRNALFGGTAPTEGSERDSARKG
jgi:hypothetical protein